MAQYQDGTVSVTNASNAVTGASTLWLANVTIGDLFFVSGDTAGYEVATIPTDTSLTLTTVYAGVTGSGKGYSITRDFTPNFDFPYIVTGDRNTALVLKRFALDVDTLLATYQPTVVQAGDGSVGAPAYSFLSDTDTGLYRIGSGHMGWSVNGVLAFDIDISSDATFAGDVRLNDVDSTLQVFNGIELKQTSDPTSSGSIKIKIGRLAAALQSGHDCFIGPHNTGGPGVLAGDLCYVPRSNVNAAHRFFTGNGVPTERLTIDASGNATFAGEIDASAGGIKLGGTAAANLLDDYEEGTWDAALVAGTSGTISLYAGNTTMAYTKIGRVVHLTGQIQVQTSSSPVGSLRLTGLPFVVGDLADTAERSGGVLNFKGLTAAGTSSLYSLFAGESEIRILKFDGQTETDNQAPQAAVNSVMHIDITYLTDL